MLEQYMEKSLYRQIFLCEQIHQYSYFSIVDMAKTLEVFPTTIDNDIEKISALLGDIIAYQRKDRKNYYIVFNDHISIYEIRAKIYQQSLFLKVCQLMLEKDLNYLDIVENLFVSVSKAYGLIKTVQSFFTNAQVDFSDKKLHCSEWSLRLLKQTLNVKLNETPETPAGFENACREFIGAVAKKYPKINFGNMREICLIHGLAVVYERQNIRKAEDSYYYNVVKDFPYYKNLKQIWYQSLLKDYLNDEEFTFVFYLFHVLDYSYKEILETYRAEEVIHELIFEEYSEFGLLAARLATHLNVEKGFRDEAFKQAFIRMIRTCYENRQLLLPHPIYLVEPILRPFSDEIFEIVEDWGKNCNPIRMIDYSFVYRFVNEYARLHHEQKFEIEIKIVTDSQIKYLLYHDFLEKSWLKVKIDPIHYNNLTDAIESSNQNVMVVCESHYFNAQINKPIPIVPIDLSSLKQPVFGQRFYQQLEQIPKNRLG